MSAAPRPDLSPATEVRWSFMRLEASPLAPPWTWSFARRRMLPALFEATGWHVFCVADQEPRWRADASQVLLRFARGCALEAVHLWPSTAEARAFLQSGDPAAERATWLDARSRFEVFRWPTLDSAARSAYWAAYDGQEPQIRAQQAAIYACSALAAWARGHQPPNHRAAAGRQARDRCRQAQEERLLSSIELLHP